MATFYFLMATISGRVLNLSLIFYDFASTFFLGNFLGVVAVLTLSV